MRATFLTTFNSQSIFFLFILLNNYLVNGALKDYVNGITAYFGYNQENENTQELYGSEFPQNIPYEVSALDEKFISEAAKLTGVAFSELDSCQHRVSK